MINKKLWREVTKGLNLPSSITSAAFTLRTQSVALPSLICSCQRTVFFRYMKYLYPYECEKLQLSSPGELQAAIGTFEECFSPSSSSFAFLLFRRQSSRRTSTVVRLRILVPTADHATAASASSLVDVFDESIGSSIT